MLESETCRHGRLGAAVLCVGLVVGWFGSARADVYVSENGNGTIVRIDPAGVATTFASGLSSPQGLVRDSAGDFFVTSSTEIHEFSPTGTDLGTFASTGLSNPGGLAIGPDGDLYLANRSNGTVNRYSPTGTDLGTFVNTGAHAQDLAFDSLGNLYVTRIDNFGNGTVAKYSSTGTSLGNFATGLSSPIGLVFDSSDNLFVSEFGNGDVRKFSSTGTSLGVFASGLGAPEGMAFDDLGNLLVADFGFGNIKKYSPTGTPLGLVGPTGQSGPAHLVFVPVNVPEPSTLVLMGAGLVCLGGSALRRRRRPR